MFPSRSSSVSGLRFKSFLKVYLLIFGCAGSSLLRMVPLVVAGGGCSSVVVCGLLLLQSMDSRCAGSVIVAHRLCCPKICGILSQDTHGLSGNLPRPGTERVSPALAGGPAIFNHWTAREALTHKSLIHPMFILCMV